MANITLPCGCTLFCEKTDDKITSIDLDLEIEEINLNCDKTWDLISDGNTVGVFQLDSFLGRKLASETKPRSIQELSDLVAIMRPGTLESKLEDGKSLTEHYIERKHGREDVPNDYPAIHDILKDTYHVMCYQEQAIKIAQNIAGMSLSQADYYIRKGIGKKLAHVIEEGKKLFLDGCKKNKLVSEKEAEEIFGWIEKSARYSFNESHSISYAIDGYKQAYCKAHFPKAFYVATLIWAKDLEEINKVISDAKNNGIDICIPDIRKKNEDFMLIDGKVCFGLSRIRGVGKSSISKIQKLEIPERWAEFLISFGKLLGSKAMNGLISAGALDFYNETRNEMLFEYRQFEHLTIKQLEWLSKQFIGPAKLVTLLREMRTLGSGKGCPCGNIKSLSKLESIIHILQNPPVSLNDSPQSISSQELTNLGISLTCSELDVCNTDAANFTCKEYNNGRRSSRQMIFATNIDRVNQIKTKNGKDMAFIDISDESGKTSAVVFPDTWENNNNRIFEGNTVLFRGKESNKGSLIVEKIWQI